jgi:NhaP-type Na+/H+ and K+/H+ antiporter
MRALISRVTVFGKVLIVTTVVVAAAVAITRWMPAIIALVVLLFLWVGVYASSDPIARRRFGDDPARDAEQRWNLD